MQRLDVTAVPQQHHPFTPIAVVIDIDYYNRTTSTIFTRVYGSAVRDHKYPKPMERTGML